MLGEDVSWFELNLKDDFFLRSNTKCAYIIFYSCCMENLLFSSKMTVDDDDCWWCKFDRNADGSFFFSYVYVWWNTQLLSICRPKLYTNTSDDDTSEKHPIIDVDNVGKKIIWACCYFYRKYLYTLAFYMWYERIGSICFATLLFKRHMPLCHTDPSFVVLDAFDMSSCQEIKKRWMRSARAMHATKKITMLTLHG